MLLQAGFDGLTNLVVGTDHSQVESGSVHCERVWVSRCTGDKELKDSTLTLVLDSDGLGRRQISQCLLDQLGEEVGDVAMGCLREVVVVGVGGESSVSPSPRQPIDSIPASIASSASVHKHG